jgi:hypothetical protein
MIEYNAEIAKGAKEAYVYINNLSELSGLSV